MPGVSRENHDGRAAGPTGASASLPKRLSYFARVFATDVTAAVALLTLHAMTADAFVAPPSARSASQSVFSIPDSLGLLPCGLLIAALIFGAAAAYWRLGKKVVGVRRLSFLFDVLDEGIVICAGMQVVSVNTSLCRLLNDRAEMLQGAMISRFIHDADAINRLLTADEANIETELHGCNGSVIPVEIAARTIDFAGAPRRLMEIRDIRERKAAQKHISFLAHFDPLTGLPNREMLMERVAASVEQARQGEQRCALFWIDLDRFKEINDIHGHVAGDRMLRAVAEKLRFELPADVMISRFGGDEFVVFYDQIADATEARLLGQQLRRLLNRALPVDDQLVPVGASLGVAVFPDDADSSDELFKNADLALQHAKTDGRGRCRLFGNDIGEERQRRTTLTEQLKGAIENGEIQAHFQPLVRTADGKVAAFEALGRWFHPEFGPIPPPEFVRIAEQAGLITPLTEVIIRRAIEAARQWPEHIRVCVNVSPVQINSELVDQVRHIVTSSGLNPHRLELEVTEDVLIKDFEQTASMFARLRALGIQLAMDDFGAGYTSLGNLRRLNFDRIKIDRIFTNDLPDHRRSGAIVRGMLVLARELELEVTVEGVETAEQFAFLRAEGCAEVQGYLFSKPKSADAFADPSSLQFKLPTVTPAPTAAALIDIGKHRKRA